MPNIILIGFDRSEVAQLTREITKLLTEIGKAEDSVITDLPSTTTSCSTGTRAPHVLLCSSSEADLDEIAAALNEVIGLGVQKKLTNGFLPPPVGSRWVYE
ncbi:MAG: hypothetical protein JWN50_376 [Parcubacteria group bacterium]|nr:hypothetical protein [Parcubacteria group bacterium]